ncbi:MAG: hypothetical protein HY717_18755 [Planctomycetes bacterium]|nr:hypothetical protein [Planctomycetota bacterium]
MNKSKPRERRVLGYRFPAIIPWLLVFLFLFGCKHGGGNGADPNNPPGDQPAFPFLSHVDQAAITSGVIPFQALFSFGDELFEAKFNSLDGVGALQLPDGTPLPSRFSRVPPGGGRFTGPNAQSCEGCHNFPFGTGAGEPASNVFQDPSGTGAPPFNQRNTISLFGSAVLQRLAEEITEDLHALKDQAASVAVAGGPAITVDLFSKGISYGRLTVSRQANGQLDFDFSAALGVDPDLVIRPYGWKGNVTTLRDFCRGAALNELGMEAGELVSKDFQGRSDPDGDGVEEELSVGDITALTIYVGAQEIPQPLERLVRDRLAPPPSAESANLASRGQALFSQIGCAECHVPELRLNDPVFAEPTLRGRGNYLDTEIDPATTSLNPSRPFRFNLVQEGDFPRLTPHPEGGARVQLFSDLKRHAMGSQLADAQATSIRKANGGPLIVNGMEIRVSPDTFLTAELWGAGNTGPWLHDGRAGTLKEAIELHGGEAQASRDAFMALSAGDQIAVAEFLKSLLLFSLPEEEAEE